MWLAFPAPASHFWVPAAPTSSAPTGTCCPTGASPVAHSSRCFPITSLNSVESHFWEPRSSAQRICDRPACGGPGRLARASGFAVRETGSCGRVSSGPSWVLVLHAPCWGSIQGTGPDRTGKSLRWLLRQLSQYLRKKREKVSKATLSPDTTELLN